jgi:hypothetical protein
MKISGKTLLFGKWLSELDFILKGADRLVETAEKARALHLIVS